MDGGRQARPYLLRLTRRTGLWKRSLARRPGLVAGPLGPGISAGELVARSLQQFPHCREFYRSVEVVVTRRPKACNASAEGPV
jgi:hypothetical protein